MKTFEQFFLEYYEGDPILNPNFNKGKDVNRINSRKNMNTKPIEYSHMSPDVEAVAKGRSKGIVLKGPRLQNLLKQYNIVFQPGTKGLGRTHAVLVMRMGPDGPEATITPK